jgi:hypothetical protein
MGEEIESISLRDLSALLIGSYRSMLVEITSLEKLDASTKPRLRKWMSDSQQKLLRLLVLIKWLSKASMESSAVAV